MFVIPEYNTICCTFENAFIASTQILQQCKEFATFFKVEVIQRFTLFEGAHKFSLKIYRGTY